MTKRLLISAFLICACTTLSAQVYLRSNLLGLVMVVPNAGLEFGLSDHSTVLVEGYYSPIWNQEDFKAKGFMITPEYRYYFCQSFNGHYIGAHGNYARYTDLKTRSKAPIRDGHAFSAGLTYGHTWKFDHHWLLDMYVGAGWVRMESDITADGRYEAEQDKIENKFSLTRLGISFGYRF
ncbi:MAG: DUF3575 domain-containing protein [Rikenellaceae bacterium]